MKNVSSAEIKNGEKSSEFIKNMYIVQLIWDFICPLLHGRRICLKLINSRKYPPRSRVKVLCFLYL